MDHWSNLNLNQAYSRLQTPANRFDLHLLEQQGFATAGLGAAAGLTSPLPAHATAAAAARSFTGLPHVNYGAIPMAPLFDSMAQLTQGFAVSQSPYRAAMQGVGGQPTVYAIDSSGHPVSSAGRFVASIVAATAGGNGDTQLKTVSLFNTDPHTMADPVASSVGGVTVQPSSSASSQVGYGGRNSGHAAPANPYAGLPSNYATGVVGSDRYTNKTAVSVTAGEPPPAHSGSRLQTTTRTPSYPTKEFTQPPISVQRPQPPATTTQSRDMQPPRSVYIPVEQRQSEANPPTAHSNLQRPGDDLMQKLLLSYGPRGPVQAVSVGRSIPITSFTSSSPVQMVQALATAGRSQNHGYVDPSRGQGQRVTVSAYQNYSSIASPIHYAPAGYVPAADDVMEELSYDDVSSPEGMVLQDAAGNLDGSYLHNSGIGNKEDARHVIQSCSAHGANRQNSLVLGRIAAIPDPTIQAQADSTTRPKKGGSAGRAVRSAPGETVADRGGKRSRSGSSRSRAKGKTEEDIASAGVQHRAPEMSLPELSAYGATTAYAQLLPAEFGSPVGQSYVTADTFGQYRVSSDPYQVVAAECMIASGTRPDLPQHRMGTVSTHIDGMVRSDASSVQQQEAQVFMTNMFGNTFVNPNELLSVEQITYVEHNDAPSATYTAPIAAIPKQDPKHRPIIEEEFGHLADDPLPCTASTTSTVVHDVVPQLPANSATSSSVDQQKSVSESKASKPPQSSAFMDSFMNFIQGKKPETLASVSTSVVTKKPVLPKYIPEPPRPKPPPMPAVVTPPASTVNTKPGASTNSNSDAIVVQFSDDEDEEPMSKRIGSNITNAVNRVLLSLNKTDSVSPSKISPPKTPVQHSTPGAGKPRARSVKVSPGDPTTVKGNSTSKSKAGTKKPRVQKRGSKTEKWVDGGVVSDDDVVVLDSPVVPPRERPARKAKEVASQRGRAAKKHKGKDVPTMLDIGSEDSLDDVEPDSDDDVKSTHERGYDSDKDPAWKPSQATQLPVKKISVTLSSGSEDESINKSRGSGRGRARGRGRGRASTTAKMLPSRTQTSSATLTANASNALHEINIEMPSTDTSQCIPASSKRDLENEAVKESFSVYVQTLISQALEPTFMTALLAQPDDYYIDPLQKIDALLAKKKMALTSLHAWTPNFLVTLTKCSSYSVMDSNECTLYSEATSNRVDLATKRVRFDGFTYNSEMLQDITEVDNGSVKEFLLTSQEADILPKLHGLHHFKFNLLLTCQVKVNKLKEVDSGVADDHLLDQCLCDQPWISQMFSRLSSLLD